MAAAVPSLEMDTRMRGHDKLKSSPRLDRGAMSSMAVDTRVRGYDNLKSSPPT